MTDREATRHGGRGEVVPVEEISADVATVPTDGAESDGTLAWDQTTIVIVRASAAGRRGVGWTYSDASAGRLVAGRLAPLVVGTNALDVRRTFEALRRETRNLGRPGIVSCALSAVDTALWDLKARLLEVSLVDLFGAIRDDVPAYASGGFTSHGPDAITREVEGWVEAGFSMVKMKIGRRPAEDLERVAAARAALGTDRGLFVDANGAFTEKEAMAVAEEMAQHGVTWFEEPVSSDDVEGLRRVRDRAPAGMEVAAGEYGYDAPGFCRLLVGEAVDVLQADATRCGGYTGFLRAAELCEAFGRPLSAHTAPALHAPVCVAVPRVRHMEHFHDHARIEALLFEGVVPPRDGRLLPDRTRPGHGLRIDEDALSRYREEP